MSRLKGGNRQYRCQLRGLDSGWRKPSQDTQFEWTPQASGRYTFEVQAIDRDLNYSESASVVLEVIPDPRDAQIALLESELERRNRELEAELADARDMQMRLLPEHPPAIDGAQIAGRCVTANTVGGDFFDYLTVDDHLYEK